MNKYNVEYVCGNTGDKARYTEIIDAQSIEDLHSIIGKKFEKYGILFKDSESKADILPIHQIKLVEIRTMAMNI